MVSVQAAFRFGAYALSAAFALCAVPCLLRAAPQYDCGIQEGSEEALLRRSDGLRLFGKRVWTLSEISKESKRIQKRLENKKKPLSEAQREKLIAKRNGLSRLTRTLRRCPAPELPREVDFSRVQPIISARCMSCHQVQGAWTNTEEWLVSNAKVVPGRLSESPLYTYLSNNPEGYLPGYMPKGLAPLSIDEIGLIGEWILAIDPQRYPPPARTFAFVCDASAPIPHAPLKRLSRLQLRNTFLDLLNVFSPSEQALIYGRISAALETFPADTPQQNFLEERAFAGTDLSITPLHIGALYDSAKALADEVTLHSERRRVFSHGNCNFGTNTSGRNCVRNFIRKFGRRAHRRALTNEEEAIYETFYFSRPSTTAYRELIITMLMSPDFFYHREVNGSAEGDVLTLDAFEVANRLSYLFWQTMPDEVLFDAAADGSLLTASGYETQLDRLYNSPRTQETIDLFFEELLGVHTLPALNGTSSAAFEAFAAGLGITPGDTLLPQQMRTELDDMVQHYVWETNSNFDDLFTSAHSFARSPQLAALYGVPVWDGSSANLVPFPSEAEARGLLGRALFQISGSHLKETAKLGARILREWNCSELSDPPPDLMNQIRPPAYDPTKSTRQRYEDLTAPVSCAGCHVQINPLGFAMERLDALGRYREIERIYDTNGTLVNQIPINSAVTFSPLPGVSHQVSTPIEVFRAMSESHKVQACFAQQYFRFAYRRHESLASDSCVLKGLHD
jgi:mono/diheme cytochrome c family protein